MADYSILTSNIDEIANKERIEGYLCQGIKVIAFGHPSDLDSLSIGLEEYKKAHLLQLYPVLDNIPSITIRNGILAKNDLDALETITKLASGFNYEQYLIEHADVADSLIVEAGAGTGKTTVMIDRILFLLRTVPGLTMEDIGLITFTNEATQNMKKKIQEALMKRYKATKLPEYLTALESSAKLHIQTIHSFSRSIINELGPNVGYAQSIALKSFKYERQQIIRDVLNEAYKWERGNVEASLGAPLHKLDRLLLNFWIQLENIGLTDEEIAELDWGEAADGDSKALHNTLRSSFTAMNERYKELKIEEDAIAVGDIVRELRWILDQGETLKVKGMNLKYLFVDEFQDSDNAQIETIAWLQKAYDLKLFAVGDAKQSIYRFRGAVETAFDKLRGYIKQNTGVEPNEFTLTRNYRTSQDILTKLEPVFRHLEREGVLAYGKSLVPQRKHPGRFCVQRVRMRNKVIKEQTVNKLRELLKDHLEYMDAIEEKEDPSHHVTVLTRTNFQLSRIGRWCEEARIPCYIKKEGTFYASQAVRDFYCMVKAYVFPTSTVHLYDYLNSAYTTASIDAEEISRFAPGSAEQLNYLWERLRDQDRERYHREFRLKPVLSVLRQIIDEKRPVEQYVAKRKSQLRNERQWREDELEQQLAGEASQYEANLEKLLQIIRGKFSGQMVSLYQIYSFLQMSIATNRDEDEPDVSGVLGPGCIYGMTVHKAKGLEFDTVLVPFTHRPFRKEIETELILDEGKKPKRVGWSRVVTVPGTRDEVETHQYNTYYKDCLRKEFEDVDREEARLLYVALTRAIRRLDYFVIGNEQHSWAHMLEV